MESAGFESIFLSLRQATLFFLSVFCLFSILLVFLKRKKNKKSSNLLILLSTFFFSVHFISFLITLNNPQIHLPLLFLYFPSLIILPSLSYLYIKSLTTDNFQLARNFLIHTSIPLLFFALSFIYNIPIISNLWLNNEIDLRNSIDTFLAIQFFGLDYLLTILFLVYTTLSIREYIKYRTKIPHIFSYTEEIELKWLLGFISGSILFFILVVLSNNQHLFLSFINAKTYDFIYFLASFFFISLIGIYGSGQENYIDSVNYSTLKGIKKVMKEDSNSGNINNDTIVHNELTEELKEDIKKGLKSLFEEEKIYLDDSLTLVELANKLNTNRTYLSLYINEIEGVSFYDFISKYRIEDAKSMLTNIQYEKYSIEGIAGLCGYKSRTTFIRVFKKTTGLTPGEFKKNSTAI